MTKVVVIGAGDWGKNLVRNFAQLGALHGVCDADQVRARQLADTHSVQSYRTATDVYEDPEVDAVAIAVPAELHYEMTSAALNADKHCFVEKPLALRLDEAAGLRDLASGRKLTLMVGHLLEHHPAVQKLGELIHAGILGRVLYLYSTRLNFGKVRQAANVLWDLAVHDVSMILRLMGEEPQSVTCSGGGFLNAGIADTALATLSFASGTQAGIFVSWLYPEKEQKLVVVGSDGMAVFNDAARKDKLQLYDTKVEWVGRRPVTKRAEGQPIAHETTEPLKAECAHFLECMTSGQTPLTDAERAVRVLRVLTACQASLDQDGERKRLDGLHQDL